MPFPNEHAGRIKSDDGFEKVRRQNKTIDVNGKTRPVGFIFGIADGKSTLIPMRFPAGSWTVAEARKFANGHGAAGRSRRSSPR